MLPVAKSPSKSSPSHLLQNTEGARRVTADKKQAILLFEKSAKLDPFDANAVEKLRWVGQ